MQGLAGVFFALLVVVLFVTYYAIRREWFAPGTTAGVGIIASIILMTLTALGQGNSALQAVVVGVVVGGLFGGATIAIAWYFHSQEMQQRYVESAYTDEQAYYEEQDETV